MRYDAFISYRHGELDGLVAEKLHRMLETYRIPEAIAKKVGKKKLTRIFRDREELPTSSNLSDSINEALESSEFLLLICSKRTCGSQWVMREVERFGELRGKDRIIALLIDGEPDESFPPGLRERTVGGETVYVEPLAADVRAPTWAESIKLLKEEKLRLLAPILGCAFDDLRQRHRRRRIQQTVTIAAAVMAVALSFGAFSTYQYLQIDRQMQLKLENQSYVLAEYSEKEFAAGDPETALLLAMAALPENLSKPERPLVAAAEKSLADALSVYDVTDGFKPYRALTLPAAPGRLLLSPGEKTMAALYPYNISIFDLESGDGLVVLPTVQSTLAGAAYLSEDVIVFAGADGLQAYDIRQGKTLWLGGAATSVSVSGDGQVVAAVYKGDKAASLYSADGRSLGVIGFSGKAMRVPADDTFVHTNDALFSLSEDGGLLAVSFSDGSLSVFDTGSAAGTEVYGAHGAVHYEGGFSGDVLAWSLVETSPYKAALRVYDAGAGQEITAYDSETSSFTLHVSHSGGGGSGSGGGSGGGIFAAQEQEIRAVDPATGNLSIAASGSGRIAAFTEKDGSFLICESLGPYRFTFKDRNALVYDSGYVCHLAELGSSYALTGSHDSKTVRVLKYADHSDVTILDYDRGYRFSEAKINSELGRVALFSYEGMRLLDLGGNIVSEQKFDNPLEVFDTRYDAETGNIIVLYEGNYKVYSGVDGSLALEAAGSPFDFSLPDFIKGEFPGGAEAYRCGDYVFVSPANGDASAYTKDGRLVRVFTEKGYMAEVYPLGEYFAADYISTSGARYTYLLKPGTLETVAFLPGFLGEETKGDVPSVCNLVLDDGHGHLRAVPLCDTIELMEMARQRLGGRTLTAEEIQLFRAG